MHVAEYYGDNIFCYSALCFFCVQIQILLDWWFDFFSLLWIFYYVSKQKILIFIDSQLTILFLLSFMFKQYLFPTIQVLQFWGQRYPSSWEQGIPQSYTAQQTSQKKFIVKDTRRWLPQLRSLCLFILFTYTLSILLLSAQKLSLFCPRSLQSGACPGLWSTY